jgi:class 3 adenylate cyclase
MSLDVATLSMTEIIRLQDLLSKELKRRFERHLALAFCDIVGSTLYFSTHGDEAGRKLQQRHVDLLQRCIGGDHGGRIVDTAGDGAFLCFPTVEAATDALIEFQRQRLTDNADRPESQWLEVRVGVHWGPVLTDGVQVTGDAVNLCARIAGSAEPSEIRLSREAFRDLHDPAKRLSCMPLPLVKLKGIQRTIEMVRLQWADPQRFPDRVLIKETCEDILLPPLATITFGRLPPSENMEGNHVVLQLPNKKQRMQISRWHFELRRRPDGLVLYQVSDNVTEVDGVVVARGTEVPVRADTIVRVGKVMTLTFVTTKHVVVNTDKLDTRCPVSETV